MKEKYEILFNYFRDNYFAENVPAALIFEMKKIANIQNFEAVMEGLKKNEAIIKENINKHNFGFVNDKTRYICGVIEVLKNK